MKQALVIFGEDWGRHPSSTQHLALRLAEQYDITWVNSVGLRAPRLNLSDLGRIISKAKSFLNRKAVSVVKTPFNVINLPALPFPASKIAFFVNKLIWRKKLAYLYDSKPFIWASLPTALSILGELNERGVIYYCGDDFNALAGVDHSAVTALESQLALQADAIFTVSDRLSAKFDRQKTTLLPHGVDYNLFATPAPRASDLPVGKPIAGFYGSLSNWLDLEMLDKAADALPDWNFVFVGDEHIDVSSLKAKSNVFFLGSKPHSELPSYVQHFNVALLPFLDNEQIRACNPLKLREYLASGTPIVSSFFPALTPYIDNIEICEGDNLAAKILIASNTKSQAPQRQASVFSDSWENRAAQVIQIMERIS